MEILLFIFPLLSYFIFQFLGNFKSVKILYSLHSVLIISSFVISLYLFLKLLNLDNDLPLYFYPIIKLEYFLIDWSLRLDLFVSSLIIMITLVGSICTIYFMNFNKSKKIDLNIIKYSCLLIFGALTLVSSNDLIQIFIGWKIIILSTYFLTKHSKEKNDLKNNSDVFLYNRLSELGVFLCLFFLYSYTNSLNFDIIFESSYLAQKNIFFLFNAEFSIFELILFVLLLSFLLRCRQFFIKNSIYYFIEINSAITALIFSGIYLPVGIYFILRFLPLTHSYSNFLSIITLLGFVLIIIFTYLTFKSKQLKNLIIYISCSQFSIIIFLIGLEVYNAAFFYFFTSILSLTMLFLVFDILITKLNGEHNINKMGSLLIKTPSTFLFTLIGVMSLLGIPFFSGFYSKNLIFSSIFFLNETFMFFSIICLCYLFLLSYSLFKNILIIFWCKNNCNIHLYNKINEKMFLTKIILLPLAMCLVISGWFLNSVFSGSNPAYLWNLVINFNSNYSISHDNQIDDWFVQLTNFICLSGLLLSLFNYILIPKIGNNVKIKHNKLFKKYSSYLSSST